MLTTCEMQQLRLLASSYNETLVVYINIIVLDGITVYFMQEVYLAIVAEEL